MNEREIFTAALEIEGTSERSRFLDDACRGDPPRRRRHRMLLIEHQRDDSFLLDCARVSTITPFFGRERIDEQTCMRPCGDLMPIVHVFWTLNQDFARAYRAPPAGCSAAKFNSGPRVPWPRAPYTDCASYCAVLRGESAAPSPRSPPLYGTTACCDVGGSGGIRSAGTRPA